MTRRSSPRDPSDGPVEGFAERLRSLREQLGAQAPSVDEISEREGIPRSTLYAALSGRRLPRREVVAALARSWGADETEWLSQRAAVEAELGGQAGLSEIVRNLDKYRPTDIDELATQGLDILRSAGSRVTYRPGTVLCRKGEPADTVWVVEQGIVKITRATDGGDTLLVAVRGAGDLLGERSALEFRGHAANIIAVTTVIAAHLPAEQFRMLATSRADLALVVIQVLVRRLREADEMRAEVAYLSVTARLAQLLLRFVLRHGKAGPDDRMVLDLPITQTELANLIGATRESTVRALRALRETGMVKVRRGGILIRVPE